MTPQGEHRVMIEADICNPGRPGIVGNHQKVEGARKCSSLGPSEGVWPHGHLAFRFLASRAVREDISVVVSYPFCGNLLEQL